VVGQLGDAAGVLGAALLAQAHPKK
jgi:hypothetical protein